MSEQALGAHLKRWEQRQEEMVEVEKGYLDWLERENKKLRRMVIEAHEACTIEYMPCPWCEGLIGNGDERHDECCPWPSVKEKWTEQWTTG